MKLYFRFHIDNPWVYRTPKHILQQIENIRFGLRQCRKESVRSKEKQIRNLEKTFKKQTIKKI